MSILSSGWQGKIPRVPVEQWAFFEPFSEGMAAGLLGSKYLPFLLLRPRKNAQKQHKNTVKVSYLKSKQNKKVLDRFGTKIWSANQTPPFRQAATQWAPRTRSRNMLQLWKEVHQNRDR